ncbi:TolC family outer membrane protein [Halomonas llamarensis]|uniref:TolC family outer membrane protein n=1 Tax=Halomonas llamarensis TaxID=2945104 RepID=A0ABT0SSH9_9GAMM|nr:TolC family outer membrane protein [Halomonas llamarensis]MCL7930777.1 TolC family outer membrane protein [Halomonas llamarensis]
MKKISCTNTFYQRFGLTRIIQAAAISTSLTLLPLSQAMAQSLPSGMSIPGSANLQETVQQAITQNPEVNAAFRAFNAAGYDRDEAWGGYLPSVDATAGVERESVEGDGRGSNDTDFVQLELTQMVYDGFATASRVEQLDRAELVRYYELLGASETVALEATRAYADVLRYRELVRLAQDNYREHMRVYDQIEERALSGAGRGVDLEQITGRVALAESNLMTEASNLHDVSARYNRIVGDLPVENLEATPELSDELPSSVQEAVNLAFEGNPDFHAAIEDIAASRAEQNITQSGFHPRVDIVGRTGSNNDDSSAIGRRDQSSIELVASMNLYRGGSDLASFRAASERIEEAVDNRELACRNVRQTTQIAYGDTQRLREQMQYLNQHRQSIDRVRGAYQQQFDIGERTLLDVLDSENEFFEASRAYVNAQYDVAIADAETLASMGHLMRTLDVSRADMPSLSDLGSDGVELNAEAICPTQAPANYTLEDLVGQQTLTSVAPPARAPDVTLSADAIFAINSAELSAGARQELMSLADSIRGRANVARVYIAGHADNTGSDAINDPLSRRRAESVGAFLTQQGVDGGLIQTEGFGSNEPIASNATVNGRRQNRRVEVTIETRQETANNPSFSERQTSLMPQSPQDETFFQVAALSDPASAADLQVTLEQSLSMPIRIVDGGGFYRVQVGTTADAVPSLRRQLSDMGFDEAFPVNS